MPGKQTLQMHPNGKPVGMSDAAWKQLHKVIAKIHMNHLDELREIQERKMKEAIG